MRGHAGDEIQRQACGGRQPAAAQPEGEHGRGDDHGEPAMDELGRHRILEGVRPERRLGQDLAGDEAAAHEGEGVVDLAAVQPGREAAGGQHADDEDEQDEDVPAQAARHRAADGG